MSLKQRTVKAGIWALLQNGGRQVISTFVFLVLARFFLNKDDFGLVALATVTIAFLTVLVRQGLSTAIVQRISVRDEHIDSAFVANVAAGVLISLIVVFCADPFSRLLGDQRVAVILQVMSVNLLLISLGLSHESLLTRELKFKSLATRTLISSVVSGLVGICVAYAGGGVWALVSMQISMTFSGLIVLWWASPWRPKWRFSSDAFRELLPVSLGAAGIAIVSVINDYADQFIVGKLLGVGALGVYVVAQKVVKLLFTVFFMSITSIALPSFSRLNGDTNRARNGMLSAMAVTTVFSFPVFLGLAVTADLVVPIVFGRQWIEAAPVMSLLCAWGAIGSVTYYFGPILQALGHTQIVFRYVALGAALLTVLCTIGSQFGLIGFSIAVLATPLSTLPWWINALQRHIGVSGGMLVNAFSRNLIAALFMVISVIVLRQFAHGETLAFQLTASILVGATTYATALLLVANANAKSTLSLLGLMFKK